MHLSSSQSSIDLAVSVHFLSSLLTTASVPNVARRVNSSIVGVGYFFLNQTILSVLFLDLLQHQTASRCHSLSVHFLPGLVCPLMYDALDAFLAFMLFMPTSYEVEKLTSRNLAHFYSE